MFAKRTRGPRRIPARHRVCRGLSAPGRLAAPAWAAKKKILPRNVTLLDSRPAGGIFYVSRLRERGADEIQRGSSSVWLECRAVNPEVAGSSPVYPAIFIEKSPGGIPFGALLVSAVRNNRGVMPPGERWPYSAAPPWMAANTSWEGGRAPSCLSAMYSACPLSPTSLSISMVSAAVFSSSICSVTNHCRKIWVW